MPLIPGSRLGPYEILAAIGAGGMGEVYRARDTRLDRTVAIKVLPQHLASRPELRQRLEREARAVSSLSHPHICTLYDVGREADFDFLVMEYLQGETLAQRLTKGRLPSDQLLRYAVEIAEALDKAHSNGVTHRDLKPSNVMITKNGAKLLDFGLAKTTPPQAGLSASTLTAAVPLTEQGTIIGTFQYMAPEQLEGQEADARSDIHAFGATLFEMATGRPAFTGRSQASLIATIMESEPPSPSSISPVSPPALDRVVKICLAKDPEERWQTMRDLTRELKWIAQEQAGSSVSRPAGPNRLAWWVSGILIAAVGVALVFVVIKVRRPHPVTDVIRFTFEAALGGVFGSELPSVSPDGKQVAFWAKTAQGTGLLSIRSLDSTKIQPLPGTENVGFHFWSANGQSIAFFADQKLKRIKLAGGPAQILCDADLVLGGSWNAHDDIVLAPQNRVPLQLFHPPSGKPAPLTALDESKGENSHRWPYFLPDGQRFLYLARSSRQEDTAIYMGSLEARDRRRLLAAQSSALYAPPSETTPGYLLFVADGNLMAQAFDERSLTLSGEPILIAENVYWIRPSSFAAFSLSADGKILAYRGAGGPQGQLGWFDRSGQRLQALGPPGEYSTPKLSPDGQRVLVNQPDNRTGNRDVWAMEVSTGVVSRLTTNPANEFQAIWSPDGKRIVFLSDRGGHQAAYVKSASGLGSEDILTNQPIIPYDWSRDGRQLVVGVRNPRGGLDLSLLALEGDRKLIPVVQTEFTNVSARISPDGKWMTYTSNESGRFEVYVTSLPGENHSTGRWRISSAGGADAQWRRDGKEVYYVAPDRTMMVSEIKNAVQFNASVPRPLFKMCGYNFSYGVESVYAYDVAADGKRFLISCLKEDTTSSTVTVVVNWQSAVKR